MEYPLVSIITGYYNRKGNLNESVGSILNQSYPNFEYIIFDDCSTDGTSELLKKINDPRLKVLKYNKNEGFTKGIIRAIDKANGEFIAIHGAGDISLKDRIKNQIKVLDRNKNIGIVGCLSTQFDGDVAYQEQKKKFENSSEEFSLIRNFNSAIIYKNFFLHGEVMFRKSVYEKVGGYDPLYKYAQDRDLWVRMSNYCDAGIIQKVLYERGSYKNSVSRNFEKRIEQQFFTCLSREREIKGGDFNFAFRDKYEYLSEYAIQSHYKHRKTLSLKEKKLLIDVAFNESSKVLNKLYCLFNNVIFINWLIFKILVKKSFKYQLLLKENYGHLKREEIYSLAVLRNKY